MLNKDVFAKGIMLLTESLPPKPFSRDLSERTLEIWYEVLSDLDNKDFESSVMWHLRNAKFRPVPAEIREAVKNLSEPIKTGDEAWGEVIEAISRFGYYGNPEFSDHVTAAAVERMDWQSMCKSNESDLPTIRAQFRNLYDNIKKNQRVNSEAKQIHAIMGRKTEELTANVVKALRR